MFKKSRFCSYWQLNESMQLLTDAFKSGSLSRRFHSFSKIDDRFEAPKVVISKSRRQLLKRSLIHIAPIATTIFVLVLNIHGIYIGEDFSGPIKSETMNLLILQVFAKFHELMVVGSLGVIVLHAVRFQLLYGEGLPYGLVGSGLGFNNLQFFFRKEFRSAAFRWFNGKRRVSKILFLLLLIVSGTIATFAGPSSATLLVPKPQTWPSGGTDFYLNGSQDAFWPDDVALGIQDIRRYCNSNNSATTAVCPGGGFSSLYDHWSQATYSHVQGSDLEPYAKGISGSTFFWPVHSPESRIPPRYLMGAARVNDEKHSSTFLVTPHAAPITIMRQIMTDWWQVVAPSDRQHHSEIDDRQAFSTYFNAISTVRCTSGQNISSSDDIIQFPSLQGRFDYAENIGIEISDMSKTPVDYVRFRWVHLPDKLGALSIGGLFESPWQNYDSRVVVACSVQAGWVPAQVYTDEYSFWTGWYPWNVSFGARKPFFNAVAEGAPIGKTNGRIAMDDDWLALLTPRTLMKPSGSQNEEPSTIESIFEVSGLGKNLTVSDGSTLTNTWNLPAPGNATRDKLVEAIVCSIIVDGLSRYGSHMVYDNATEPGNLALTPYDKLPDFGRRIAQGQNALALQKSDEASLTTLHIDIAITGFSYRKSLAGYLAAAVLIAHLLMALTHIIWTCWRRESSGCWSLVTELLALAHNSRNSSPQIINTGAGIALGSTFGRIVRIRTTTSELEPAFEHVELVFDEPHIKEDASTRVDATSGNQAPPSKVSTMSSFGLGTLFDDRVCAESTDTLIGSQPRVGNVVVNVVKSCRRYG